MEAQRKCLIDHCWCKDETLPALDSLWVYRNSRLEGHDDGIYRIHIDESHEEMFYQNIETQIARDEHTLFSLNEPYTDYRIKYFVKCMKPYTWDDV